MGTVTANFTVSLSAAYGQPVTVHYSTFDGTATAAGGDYQAVSGNVTFAPGDLTRTIPVLVNGDRIAEWSENFSVRLNAPANAFVSDSSGMVTIQDDEPTVTIVDSMSGNEGNTGTTAFNFTVTLSGPYDAPVSVDFATADLTEEEQWWYGAGATAGVDYQVTNGTLTFDVNETSKTIPVPVIGDRVGEYDEPFWLKLTNSTSARFGNTQSLATIVNDEPYVYISGPQSSVTEGHSGTTTMTFTVTLSNPTDVPVTVSYATADGSATAAGGDYQAQTGSVTFAPNSTSMPIHIVVNGDRRGENDEYFQVNLVEPSEAQISNASAYGTIRDDEARLSISSPAAKKEGNSGTTAITFTVKLLSAYDQTVTVNYTTRDSSATVANNDYVAKSGTLTFAQGETEKTFTVLIRGDKRKEFDESFYVELTSPSSNAFIDSATGWGTILNDDGRKGPR